MAEEKAKKEAKKQFKPYKPATKFCPKCGSRMADHANRFACGKCGYAEFKEKGR
ncbi:MAG: 30S ribosomal protein S27ae [Candidatus Marsarchaeota archaeon]|nr:30S ribosomal protein S27ae [Candidatus Marsarchaeota archaeon]